MITHTFIMDTSFYGNLLTEPKRKELIDKIKATKSILIIGIDVIENELYETPLHVTYRGETTRKLLITLFEFLVDDNIRLPPIAAYLAEQYLEEYRKKAKKPKKHLAEKNLRTDFEIIALASLRAVDVVVSADKRTMLSDSAKKAYDAVNAKNSLRTPELVDYESFKQKYLTETKGGGARATS